MTKLTLAELIFKRSQLQDEIASLLNHFTKETGLNAYEISLDDSFIDSSARIVRYIVRVEIRFPD